MSVGRFALVVSAVLLCCQAFYFPGVEMRDFADGQGLNITVNTLRSLEAVVPFPYYSAPFCQPKPIMKFDEKIGEILWGDIVLSSLYSVRMKQNVGCQLLCPEAPPLVKEEVNKLEYYITNYYRGSMGLDNMPLWNNGSYFNNDRGCVAGVTLPRDQQYRFQRGYALGTPAICYGPTASTIAVNNHLEFTIKFHKATSAEGYRVVGFTAVPFSIKHTAEGASCNNFFDPRRDDYKLLSTRDLLMDKPYWSYSVKWVEEPNVRWASRWDSYFLTSPADNSPKIHWLYIVNSLLITLCLSTTVTMILMRTLHKDFNRYNSEDPDERQEEVGWKLVHSDVFRAPWHRQLFAVFIGTGVQLLCMFILALFFALLGFMSPAMRGVLLTTMILLFVLVSFVGGFATARVLKMFDNKKWKSVFATGLLFPSLFFSAFLFVEFLSWKVNAATAVPWTTIATLIGLWFGISLPLVVLGASFGYSMSAITFPTKVGKLAREIPTQRWYLSPPFTVLIPGFVPFGATLTELKFIFSSLWLGRVYYVFGFLAIVAIIWSVTIVLTTIVLLYYQLCFEDWRWWWRSILIPSSFGLHFFLFVCYYYTTLNITSTMGMAVYFVYMTLLSGVYFLVSGTIGFLSGFWFVRKIYAAIKID